MKRFLHYNRHVVPKETDMGKTATAKKDAPVVEPKAKKTEHKMTADQTKVVGLGR